MIHRVIFRIKVNKSLVKQCHLVRLYLQSERRVCNLEKPLNRSFVLVAPVQTIKDVSNSSNRVLFDECRKIKTKEIATANQRKEK